MAKGNLTAPRLAGLCVGLGVATLMSAAIVPVSGAQASHGRSSSNGHARRHSKKKALRASQLCTSVTQKGCLKELTTGATRKFNGHGKLIGVLLPEEYDNTYSAAYTNRLKALAKRDNIKLEIYDSNYDAATQASQATTLIAQHPAGIVLWPADANSILPSLIQMKQANIPVNISNSQAVPGDARYYKSYSGPSNFQIGAEMAAKMNTLLHGHGNIIVIEGQPGNSTSIDRIKQFKKKLDKKIKVLGMEPGNWTKAPSEHAAAELISRFGKKIDAVYAVDDTTASGVAEAEQLAGWKPGQVPILGTGDTRLGKSLVEHGWETVTLFQSPLWDADHVVDDMMFLLQGYKLPKNVYMPLPFVTKKNVAQFPALW